MTKKIEEGDWVKVPEIQGGATLPTRTGVVEILKPPYARVALTVGAKRMRMVFTVDQLTPLRGEL